MIVLFMLSAGVTSGLANTKEQICATYADRAVAQYNLGKQHNLPGIVPPAWSNDRNGHYNWCMMAPENIVNSEDAKRQAYLDKNIPKTAPANQAVTVGHMTKIIDMGKIADIAIAQGNQSYLGCFKDQKDRDLTGFSFHAPNMTKELCMTTCQQKGFQYAGLQYSSYCFCGNSYGKNGKANNCNMPCAGIKSEICGGRWANSVYNIISVFEGQANNVVKMKSPDFLDNHVPLPLSLPKRQAFIKMIITDVKPASTPPHRILTISGQKFGKQEKGCEAYLVQFKTNNPKHYRLKIRHWTNNTITATIPNHVPAGLYTLRLFSPIAETERDKSKIVTITGKPTISGKFPKDIYLVNWTSQGGLAWLHYDFPLYISWEDENGDLTNGDYNLTCTLLGYKKVSTTGEKSLKTLHLTGNEFQGASGELTLPLRIEGDFSTFSRGKHDTISCDFYLRDESGNHSNTIQGTVHAHTNGSPKVGGAHKVGGAQSAQTSQKITKVLTLMKDSDPYATFADIPFYGSIPSMSKAKLISITNVSKYRMNFRDQFNSSLNAAKCSGLGNASVSEFELYPQKTHQFGNQSLFSGKFFHVCTSPSLPKNVISLQLKYTYELTQ